MLQKKTMPRSNDMDDGYLAIHCPHGESTDGMPGWGMFGGGPSRSPGALRL